MSEPSWPEWGASADRFYNWYAEGPHSGELLDTIIGPDVEASGQRAYHIVRCHACIAIHAVPLPSLAALKRYYEATFVEQDKPGYIERCLRDKAWWDCCMHGPLLKQAAGYLPPSSQSPHVLEVGAGPGLAMDLAAQWGWRTMAIEPGRQFVEYLTRKDHEVYEGTLEDYAGAEACYDIVYLHEVLEHQPEPENFLLRCWELLRPGGVLVVVVPNDASPIQYTACRHLEIQPYWWAVPQHLFYYTPKMLQLLVRRCGYGIRDMRGSNAIDKALLSGKNYIGNETIGRLVHEERMKEELFTVKSGLWNARMVQYRRQLAEERIGREIILIAQKE